MATNSEKLKVLMDQINKDPSLSKKLGIIHVPKKSMSSASGKIAKSSPLRLKTVKKCNIVLSQDPLARPPAVVASSSGTAPNEGASCSGVGNSSTTPYEDISDSDTEDKEQDVIEDGNDASDDLSALEHILNTEEGDVFEEDAHQSSSDEFEVLGGRPKANWQPSDKAFKWFLEVADLDLKKEVLDSLKEEFKSDESLNPHFEPPKFPSSLWSAAQQSNADAFRLKSLYKSQENLCLSIKPLLSALDSCPKSSRHLILKSIQLITSTNLNLNRFRRSIIAPRLKPELRKQVLALPVTHDSFLGEDFNKATDGLIKEQAAIDKVLYKKQTPKTPFKSSSNRQNFNKNGQGTLQFSTDRSFRGARGKPSTRGRGRGGRRGGFNKPSDPQGQPSTSQSQ